MTTPAPPETQADRTRLAWRRTLIGVLGTAGIGSLHLVTVGLTHAAFAVSLLAMVVALPMWHRQIELRTRVDPATWQPLVTTIGIVAIGGSALLMR